MLCLVFPHSSFSPPFHHTTSCPTKHRAAATGSTRRSSDRKRAPYDPRHGWKNALDCRGTNVERVWGSPWDLERAPRKWDGGVRNEQRKVDATHDVGFKLSTIYTYTFQYLLHLHDKTFKTNSEIMNGRANAVTYRDEKRVLPVQYAQNAPDTQTCPLRTFDI